MKCTKCKGKGETHSYKKGLVKCDRCLGTGHEKRGKR